VPTQRFIRNGTTFITCHVGYDRNYNHEEMKRRFQFEKLKLSVQSRIFIMSESHNFKICKTVILRDMYEREMLSLI
jgi:hypothetical protein